MNRQRQVGHEKTANVRVTRIAEFFMCGRNVVHEAGKPYMFLGFKVIDRTDNHLLRRRDSDME